MNVDNDLRPPSWVAVLIVCCLALSGCWSSSPAMDDPSGRSIGGFEGDTRSERFSLIRGWPERSVFTVRHEEWSLPRIFPARSCRMGAVDGQPSPDRLSGARRQKTW